MRATTPLQMLLVAWIGAHGSICRSDAHDPDIDGVFAALRTEGNGVNGIQLELSWQDGHYKAHISCPEGWVYSANPIEHTPTYDDPVTVTERGGEADIDFRSCDANGRRIKGVLNKVSHQIAVPGGDPPLTKRKFAWQPGQSALPPN